MEKKNKTSGLIKNIPVAINRQLTDKEMPVGGTLLRRNAKSGNWGSKNKVKRKACVSAIRLPERHNW